MCGSSRVVVILPRRISSQEELAFMILIDPRGSYEGGELLKGDLVSILLMTSSVLRALARDISSVWWNRREYSSPACSAARERRLVHHPALAADGFSSNCRCRPQVIHLLKSTPCPPQRPRPAPPAAPFFSCPSDRFPGSHEPALRTAGWRPPFRIRRPSSACR